MTAALTFASFGFEAFASFGAGLSFMFWALNWSQEKILGQLALRFAHLQADCPSKHYKKGICKQGIDRN